MRSSAGLDHMPPRVDQDFKLGVDFLVTQFAGFATDYFKMVDHPLKETNRGSLYLPFEARLSPSEKPLRIVVVALNGPDMKPSQRQIRFQALADLNTDGRVATPYGRGGQAHIQAFNTLELLLGDTSPDRLEIRPMPFPRDLVETDILPRPVDTANLHYPVSQLRSTKFKLIAG